MSGGVPKRVLISQTQSNTPSKSGRWGKPGIILCNGARSRRAMCNSIQTRAKYCATPCTTPVPLNLLLFNTFNDVSKNQGVVAPTGLDTVITVYKTLATPQAGAIIVDDTNNQATTGGVTVPLAWNIPQNYAEYDDTLYQNVFSSAYSSVDFNVANMNGGDVYRFIISTYETFEALGGIDTATGVPDPSNYPLPTQASSQIDPSAAAATTTLHPRLQFNYGIASQMPPNSELNKLQIPPTPATGFTTGIAVTDALDFSGGGTTPLPGPGPYYYLTVDVTLSADKKTVTHKIVT